MAHITVQIGPCCTIPFGLFMPHELSGLWQPPVRALADPEESRFRGIRRRALRRSRRLRSSHSRTQAK